MEEERRVALEALAEKSQQVQDLQKHGADLEEILTQRSGSLIRLLVRHETSEHPLSSSSSSCCSKNRCAELSKELANQKAEFGHRVTSIREELEAECGALLQKLEEMEQERDGEDRLRYFNLERNPCFLTLCVCVCQCCCSRCQKRTT